MKMKLTVLACAALFGLTACSSGGSGVSHGGTIGAGSGNVQPTPPAPNPKPAPNPAPTPNPNPAPNPAPAPAPSATFNGVAIPAESQNGANTPVSAVGSSTLDNVTVNGINITLKQPGITAGTFTNIRKNTETPLLVVHI